MDPVQYDSKEGLERIQTLADLNQVMFERREAGYARREELHSFEIFGGRFSLDGCGNFQKWDPPFFPDAIAAKLPKVMTHEEFSAACRQNSAHLNSGIRGDCIFPPIPRADMVDPISGEGWTLENCHEAHLVKGDEEVDLSQYAGKLLSEALALLAQRTDGFYSSKFADPHVLNPKYMDMTLNEYGRPTNPGGIRCDLGDAYVVEQGDSLWAKVIRFYHHDTYARHRDRERQKQLEEIKAGFENMLKQAGFHDVILNSAAMPEGFLKVFTQPGDNSSYAADLADRSRKAPWFSVATVEGSFLYGVIGAGYPIVWLEGTGVSSHEVFEACAPEEPLDSEHPEDLLPVMDTTQLIALRNILRLSKRQ